MKNKQQQLANRVDSDKASLSMIGTFYQDLYYL